MERPRSRRACREAYPVYGYTDYAREIDGILAASGAERMYMTKTGKRDGKETAGRPTLIHAIGVCEDADVHGAVFAFGSRWLASLLGDRYPAVPYIVDLPEVDGDMRRELGIPRDAVVFGRHGGPESFDIAFARQCVAEVLDVRDDVYFLFMNTDPFHRHPRLLHLPPGADVERKVRFINTCDAMLHARHVGESFGLAVAEFSARNKPVLTYALSPERSHYEILGDKALLYASKTELRERLLAFRRADAHADFHCYRDCTPEAIMPIFKRVFLS